MFKTWYRKWFWRRSRLDQWKKRLSLELIRTSNLFPLGIPVDLHVSWGPFFNGCARLTRSRNKADIFVQIPIDWHLTNEDKAMIEEFQLNRRQLPEFILNHEYYHILDVHKLDSYHLKDLMRKRHIQAKKAPEYHQLTYEVGADRFALERTREKLAKAC